MMTKSLLRIVTVALATICLGATTPAPAAVAEVRVVTTTPTLAALAREVGGDRVEVNAILKPGDDMHDARPARSMAGRLARADLLIHTGLDAEPWLDGILRRAGNSRLAPGGVGHVDASEGVEVIGDDAGSGVHPRGNPHYLLDPWNGLIVADTIAEVLAAVAPAHAAEFRANSADFAERVRALAQEMEARLEPLTGAEALTHHATWDYVLKRFGMAGAACLEETPGAPVGAKQLRETVENLKMKPPAFAFHDEHGEERSISAVAKALQSTLVRLAAEVGAERGVETYEDLMRFNLNAMLDAHMRWRGGVTRREKMSFPYR